MPYFYKIKDAINADGTPNNLWFKYFLFVAGEIFRGCNFKNIIILGVFIKPNNVKHVFTKLPNPSTGRIERMPFEFITEDAVSSNNITTKPLTTMSYDKFTRIERTLTDPGPIEENVNLQDIINDQLNNTIIYKFLKIAPTISPDAYLHITCERNKYSILTNGLYSEKKLIRSMLIGNSSSGGNRKYKNKTIKRKKRQKRQQKTKYLRR
jgi:hypothetical protein